MSAFLARQFPDEYSQVEFSAPKQQQQEEVEEEEEEERQATIEDDDSQRNSDDESDFEEIECEEVEVDTEPDQLEVLAQLTGAQV
ncbi:hypothetical protein Daus18300_000211 [Diaporthe australafricana]|uniref:Uncharacterized protein n=1 Tax=Diaporthe australafricana TaxID=127596 RepID=A0ABR3Y810_9PEZI